MGITRRYLERKSQQGFSSGQYGYALTGPKAGEKVLVVSEHPNFSEAAGEPVYTIQYEDGTGGKLLLSEIAKTSPEPEQRTMFGQLRPKQGDGARFLDNHESSGQIGTITEIHPTSGEVVIEVNDDGYWRSYTAYRDQYEILGDDGLFYEPPEIENEDDLILE